MNRAAWRVLALALLLGLALGSALAENARVFDRAGLLTSAQQDQVQQSAEAFEAAYGMSFVLLTSDEAHEGSTQAVADEFYTAGGFGPDEEHSGALYYIDLAQRTHWLSTTGAMIDYMTQERIENAIDRCAPLLTNGDYAAAALRMIDLLSQAVESGIPCAPLLTNGDYAAAALRMIDLLSQAVESGIPQDQYRYDVVTGQRLTARHKVITTGELAVCLGVAAMAGLVFVRAVTRRYRLKGSTYVYDFRGQSRVEITGRQDDYLRTTTVRTRKPDPPSGGGGGGGGRGSAVHTGSRGVSHGGGGGRF